MRNLLHRRPLLVLPWKIVVKPRFVIRRRNVDLVRLLEDLPDGRIRVEITDQFDRMYWVRLTRRQAWMVERW